MKKILQRIGLLAATVLLLAAAGLVTFGGILRDVVKFIFKGKRHIKIV